MGVIPLAPGFVQDDPGGDGHIERFNGRCHRHGRPRIAFGYQVVRQALALGTHEKGSGTGERHAVRRVTGEHRGHEAAACLRVAASADALLTCGTTGSRNALPIEPRRAFQPNGSADVPHASTAVAPAASATRMMAPRFPGSCTFTAPTTS